MQHKGLIYTATAIVIFAIMAAMVAFSIRSSDVRTIFIDSYPSGAELWLDGEKLGETPMSLDKIALQRRGFDVGNYPLARLFTHELSYIELSAPEFMKGQEAPSKIKRGKLTFVTKPASQAVPNVFDGAKPLNEFGPRQRDIELFMRLPSEDRIVAVFNKDRIPPMHVDRKISADVTVFSLPLQEPGVPMSDFKSCRVNASSDFRKNK
jgi:PEGA domain.